MKHSISNKSNSAYEEGETVIQEIESDQVSLDRRSGRETKPRKCCGCLPKFIISSKKAIFCTLFLLVCLTVAVFLMTHHKKRHGLGALFEEIELSKSSLLNTGLDIDQKNFIPYACLSVFVHSPKHLNVIIRDCNNERWELPFEDPFPYPKDSQNLTLEESEFDFVLTKNPFRFEIKRKETNETIYKWTRDFVFTDTYIEYTFETPTNEIYGLGSRPFTLQFRPGTYSLFIIDRTGEVEDGTPGHNAQGHHPVYLMKEKSGKYHINFLRNINSAEFTVGSNNDIRWQLIGGVVDLNFFSGDGAPENVVRAYHRYIGGWSLPAFWAMGGHQHKWWGYKNVGEVSEVLEKYTSNNIALDTIWSDIEYLKDNNNFQIDTENFPSSEMKEMLLKYKKRRVSVVQAFIPKDKSNPAYNFPNVENIALHDFNGEIFPGEAWSGPAYLIDFTHRHAKNFQWAMLKQLEEQIPFSGIWLDANELTTLHNFPEHYPDHYERKYGDLPFYPGKTYLYGGSGLPPPDAIHADGTEEFNVRGIVGLLQCKYTYEYLKQKHPFPFVLTRSSMFGTGKFALTWLADYFATWQHMRYSIGTLATINIFGITFVGTDLCGFVGHQRSEIQLCARWYQLGAFYPFSKNGHAPTTAYYNNQEPYTFEGIYFQTMTVAVKLRYSILKYFYTLFFLTEGRELRAGTIFRPLFFEFYNDPNLPPYGSSVHEDQFLLGKSLMVTPVLARDVSQIEPYFPDCRWFDLRSLQEVPARGRSLRITAPLGEVPPHFLRGGAIMFTQNPEGVLRTEDLSNTFTLVIGLDDSVENKSNATGSILGCGTYDEQNVYDRCIGNECLLHVTAECEVFYNKTVVNLHIRQDNNKTVDPSNLRMDKIHLMGLTGENIIEYTLVILTGHDADFSKMERNKNTTTVTFKEEIGLTAGVDYELIFS